jgi:hypothetical protein
MSNSRRGEGGKPHRKVVVDELKLSGGPRAPWGVGRPHLGMPIAVI